MAEFLQRIIERKRSDVGARLFGKPVPAMPTNRSLRAALGRPGARFVMETKQASPSGHRARFSLGEALAAYAPVADAISVLTDEPDFGGSLNDLRIAREQFDGPILAKDFIVDAAQVSEARSVGADAVLAMMSVLSDQEAAAVLAEAGRLAMDAIVEVHDEIELGRALALGASIIGINNRDLRSLQVDLSVTERLAPLVPADVLVVAESGISYSHDVERLAPLVDAFLVGSSLMASPDIAEAARALVHGRVKICGLTGDEDIALSARSGATHAGLIFVPGSPRAIGRGKASEMAELARKSGLKTVGVFRDSGIDEVAGLADIVGLDAVQLHGSEPREILSKIRSHLPTNVELWAVRGVGAAVSPGRPGVDRALFDSVRDGTCGGTGKPFDWSLLTGYNELPNAFLAGGIGPDNASAASKVGAYGLDVGSSIELRPGVKDANRMAALFAALRPEARARS